MAEAGEPIIGIDLGTTNSVVATLEGDKPVVILNSEGSNRTPSVVAFLDNGEMLVGEMALRQAAANPTRTISAVKRLMGRFYSDLEEDELSRSFKIADHNDEILIEVDGKGYTPPQLSSLVLAKLKATAESHLGAQVTKAVITVPAYFDDLQREATIEAGRLAGLEVLRLINEPTAAAMAYGLDKDEQETIAVYDFGGGTFDVSLLEVDRNSFEVLTSHGDTRLGGEDIDQLLLEKMSAEFEQQHGINLRQDPMSCHRLKEAAEKAKCELSTMTRARVSLPFIAYKDGAPLHLDATITREEFEQLIEPLVERTIQICKAALADAALKRNQINKVIMVGGSSRIPLVQEMVGEYFDQDPFRGVHPDEVVALGAATQAAVFGGKLEEVILLDVTPHSLGIEVMGSRFCPVIEKNATIPIKAAKVFTTTENDQEFVTVHVLQGESENAADNRSLGKFALTGLRPRPKGAPRIMVTFFINSDGVVEISAKDTESGATKSLSIVHSHLTQEERTERRRQRTGATRRQRLKAGADKSRRDLAGVDLKGKPPGEAAPARAESFAEVLDSEVAVSADTGAAVTKPLQQTPHAVIKDGQVIQRDDTPVRRRPLSGAPTRPIASAPSPAAPPVAPPAPSTAPLAESPAPVATVPAAPAAPAGEAIPDQMRLAEAMLASGKEDTSALLLYENALGEYQAYIEAAAKEGRKTDWAILSLARIHALRKQIDEAITLLRQSYQASRIDGGQMLEACNFLIARFPNYGPALIERAARFAEKGRYDEAVLDAERAVAYEDASEEWVVLLEKYYQKSILERPDPAAEFKLVKVYLRRDKIDEAIDVLQRLVENPSYEQKALKILGLCFWQKNLYYLAWQKLRQIELNDEIKDMLYRLAADMESADQLSNARQALDHLSGADPNYRDVKARLQRISFQLKAHQEGVERAGRPEAYQLLRDSRFIILEEINRGSMGVIYRAKDVVLEEVVALKVLNDYLCSDPMAVERFKKEARAARKLTHPNIVRIHDFFESGAKRFISMEFISGKDLKKILAEGGPMPPERAAKLCATIADALFYAHSRNVIHRDIKPANIMICPDGEPRIADFGIAKVIQSDDATLGSSVIMGTPLYMAPEQIEGGDIDARADIYALGVVMYEVISGRPPFNEGNIEYHHIHTPPPPLPDTVPPAFAAIVMKAIQKNRADRFQSGAELAKALREFLESPSA